jgi:hypothetical protein
MKSKLPLITISFILLFLSWTNAKAQSDTTSITPSHLAKAESFLIATGVDTKFPAIVESIVSTFVKQVPEDQRDTYASVMRKFMNKYYTWDNLKGDLSKIYAAEFTEDELTQMIAFYNSPVGKKYSEKSVTLLQKGMQIGQNVVMSHQSELQDMIKEAYPQKN